MDNEQAVANALAKGDKQVLGDLFDQYAPALFGMALRLTESEQQASEVILEVFRKMVQDAPSFEHSKKDLFSWALDITREAAAEIEGSHEKIDFSAYQNSHPVGVNVNRIYQEVDEKQRRVIELAYLNGLSESELEKAMNFPVGTVNTRLRFAIRELRKAMK